MKQTLARYAAALLALALLTLCACAPQEPVSPAPSAPASESAVPSQPAPLPESSSQPEPESQPEEEAEPEEKTPADMIMDSYYLDDHPEVVDTFQTGLTVGRLVPEYTTGTSGKEEMRQLLENLLKGEKLADHIQFDKEYYALVYDSTGRLSGHVGVGEDFAVHSDSNFTEESAGLYRRDFRYPDLLESAIREGKIDPDTAQLKFCNIVDFATGALLYDDTREYFIPTVRDAMHTVEFQVETLYPVPELAEMLHSRIDELFGYAPVWNA